MTHPDPAAAQSADLDALIDDLWNARYGDPRFGHENFAAFPSLIARADEIGDPYWRFIVRLEAANSAAWDGTLADQVTLVAWLLRSLDRDGTELGLEERSLDDLHRVLAEVVETITGLPELGLDHAAAIVDDWERRVRGTDYESPAHAAAARAQIARHRGDRTEALRLLDSVTDFRSPAHTCPRGVRTAMAEIYVALGEHDRAVALIEPDLVDDGTGCNFFPAETHVGLLVPYAVAGRRDDVARGVAAVERTFTGYAVTESLTSAMTALLQIGDLERAHAIAVDRYQSLDKAFSAGARAQRAAVLSAVFASSAAVDPDGVLAERPDPRRQAAVRPLGEVAAELAAIARDDARAFDTRNANTVVSDQIEELLALRAVVDPAERLKAIADRSAEELLSGLTVFGPVSERRAAACAAALGDRLDELSDRSRVRARIVLASMLRATDPVAAVRELRDEAAAARDSYPAMAAQAELMADMTAVAVGTQEPENILAAPAADPSWSALSQASYHRILAASVASVDLARADAELAAGLRVLAAAERGEVPLADPGRAGRDARFDAAGLEVALNLLAASIYFESGRPGDEYVDAALVAARRMTSLASTPDERLESQTELSGALSFAARLQAVSDLGAARRLMDECVANARYAGRGVMLQQRAEVAAAMGDLDTAVEDHEQAIAVWTVEGLDHAADGAVLDLAHAQLLRDDEPRGIIEAVRPVIARMDDRGDAHGVSTGWQMLGRAQIAAGLPEDAVVSFTHVLDGLTGDEHPGYIAQVRQGRAGELMDLDRFAEAIADLEAAAELYAEVGADHEIGDVWRTAAVAAHYGGDQPAAQAYLERADQLYASLGSDDGAIEYKRARLDLSRADVIRNDHPARASELLRDVVERGRVANWIDVAVSGLHLSALVAMQSEDREGREQARRFVDDGLLLDPEHPGLHDLDEFLREGDFDS